VSAMKIGGLPISFTHEQINLPGPTYPLPMNEAAAQVLQQSGITLEVVTARITKTSVVAPALIITAPAAVPGLTDDGTTTLVIGGSQAALEGSASGSGTPLGGDPAQNGAGGNSPPAGLDTDAAGLLPATSGVGMTPPQNAALVPAQNSISFDPAAGPGRLVGLFDVELLYVLAAIAAITVLGLGQLVSFLGVRRQWSSGVG
jgi:hypothetical protein